MEKLPLKKNIIEQVFAKYPKICGINDEKVKNFAILLDFLLSENEKYNLTAIRDFEQAAAKHIYDSITIAPYLSENAEIVDVGSGAGFPALPLAILRPDLKITALDSTEKKVGFIVNASELLGLKNISGVCGRAEELSAPGELLREKFDACAARSVAELRVLAEFCLPFVKKGGIFLAMKSENALHEIKEAENATKTLGCRAAPQKISLYRSDNDNRMVWIYQKTDPTPEKYPRKFALIKKKPL